MDTLSRMDTLVLTKSRTVSNVLTLLAASLFICLSAQIALPLPFTPVPLTGQTFAVYLSALILGRRAAASVALYLFAGWIGFPVFANGGAGLALGPTFGYLVGMLAAAWLVGGLSDKHPPTSFRRAWLYCALGSCCVFGLGLAVLSAFVPKTLLISQGLLPFIPGDLIKTALAASQAAFWRRHRTGS